jgi:hypothetical protein
LLMLFRTQLLHFPSLAIMTIAATRMHRSLVEFASRSIEMSDMLCFPFLLCTHYRHCPCRTSDTICHDARAIPKAKRTAAIQITLDKAVSLHSTDEHLVSQSSERDSRIDMDGQRCGLCSRDELATDRELESGMEKSIQ